MKNVFRSAHIRQHYAIDESVKDSVKILSDSIRAGL